VEKKDCRKERREKVRKKNNKVTNLETAKKMRLLKMEQNRGNIACKNSFQVLMEGEEGEEEDEGV
ncbi:MAG: hypothetical protein ACRC7R_09825, partial [Sarcina sp.]